MRKIKVIKKNAVVEFDYQFKADEEKPKPKSKQRETVETVENWIADWRKRAESKTRIALADLKRLKLTDTTAL